MLKSGKMKRENMVLQGFFEEKMIIFVQNALYKK